MKAFLWILLVIVGVMVIAILWSLVSVGKNADARVKCILRRDTIKLATTPTEYIYKRYLQIYTPSEVFGQANEELAELIQALNKLLRSVEGTTPTKYADAYSNTVEEIADVTIMLEILTQALEIDKDQVANIKAQKVARLQDRTAALAERRGREYGKKATVLPTTEAEGR